jgi:bifunctional DNA-binding transcriptional regulator/antitoxin component of YhaV-PrlF toxin-antitoxin module
LQAASTNVPKSYGASAKGFGGMPLTQKVSFKTVLHRGNRVQVPKLVRRQFKMDTEQVLKVGISAINLWTGWQFFYAKMGRDGRITLPKLQRELLRGRKQNLTRYVMEVTLEPA